jgi:hypothetical protein
MSLTLADVLRTAFVRDGAAYFTGEIELYCESPACPAREVRIIFKDFVEEEPPAKALCPLCGGRLKLHGVQSVRELCEQECVARELMPEDRAA